MLTSQIFLSVFFQSGIRWRLDFLSLLIGIIVGAGVTVLVYRYLPDIVAWRDSVISRARETQAWVRSSVETRFQVETAEYIQTYHLGGKLAPLGDVYVAPYIIAPQSPIDVDLPFEPDSSWLRHLWPSLVNGVALDPPPTLTIRQLLLQGRRVVISAEPGAGKTTLLANCALTCAQATDMGPYTLLLPIVPVFVHLAELDYVLAPPVEGEPTPDPSPLTPLAQALQQRTSVLTGRGMADLLRQKAEAGHLLLLLDGWDELASEERPEATDWLRRLLMAYSEVQIIMAGPERGYGPLVELGFVVTGLLPWRVGQVETFTEQWRQVLEEQVRLPLSIFWEPGQLPLETLLRLWLGFEDRPSDRSESPQRWIELMETMLRKRLPRFDDETDPDWLGPVTRELWQLIAYRLVNERRVYMPRTEVVHLIDNILIEYEAQEDRGSAGRLFDTLKNSGIFVLWRNQRIGFYSPIWRDFLAANHAALFQLKDEVMTQLTDPYWAGVVRFFIGRTGAAEAVETLLSSKEPDPLSENLFQVASWMPEAVDKGDWRRKLLIQLGQLVVKGNLPVALRQRAALGLARTNESGVLSFLRQLLQQQDPVLRRVALAAIAPLGAEITLEVAEKMFLDSNPQVRSSAVFALTWLNDPMVENPLLTTLVEPDEPMNRAAAEGLALNGTALAYDVLREATLDEELHIRRAAVHGLSQLNEFWAVDMLDMVEREDDQWLVKSAAGSALETIVARNKPGHWAAPQPGDQIWLIEWAAAQERAVPGGAAAMPVLLEALADAEDPLIRIAAAITLGQLGRQNTIPDLQAALRDSQLAVREAAFIGLCMIGRMWDVPVLARGSN